MKLALILLVGSFLRMNLHAETLNAWLLSQIQKDEQLWVKAIKGIDGHSLGLLENSKYYVPHFMEPPSGAGALTARDSTLFRSWKAREGDTQLPGGYVFRLTFRKAPPLYAMSAGYWESSMWRSLELERDLELSPDHTWEGANSEYLFATLLPGPRLMVYDQRGEVKHEEVFDASTPDFEQRLDAALKPYSQNKKPVLEMISLAEYLKNPNAPWRGVDNSGQFNLRNQQQRPDEQERLKRISPLTRTAAIDLLQPTQQSPSPPSQSATQAPMTPAPTAAPAASPQPAAPIAQTPAAPVERRPLVWPWLVGIAALIVIVVVALKRRT